MDKDIFTIVPNKYIKGYEDEIMNDYELLTYIFIKRNYITNDTYVFNLIELARLLGKTDKTKYKGDMAHFKESLKKFQEKGIFDFFSDKKLSEQINIEQADNNYMIYTFENGNTEGEFTKAHEDDIDYIIKNIGDSRISVYGIVRYFMYLTSFIYENAQSAQFGYCTLNKVSDDIGLCKESKSKYEEHLEKIKLMDFEVLGSVRKDGEYRTAKTYFCRYEAESVHHLKCEVERLLREKELIILDEDKKKRINEKRKNTQNINYLKSKDEKTEDEINKLNKLLKRNTEITAINEVEKEKVKSKEEPKNKKGFINGKKPSHNNEDDWGENPEHKTPDEIYEEIKIIANKLDKNISREEIKKLIGTKNLESNNVNELNSIKIVFLKELQKYEN